MIKKISAFLLVAIMLVAVFTPLTAMAATSGKCGDNLTWTLDDYGTLTISGTGKMTDWNSSSSVPWIDYRSQIRKVIINYGVTSIGNRAFSGCYGLTSVIIPNSVTSIGDNVFSGCDSLASINIPDSVISIGSWAFSVCESLTSISIPDSVTSIGDGAFTYCESLVAILVDSSNTEYSNDKYGVLFNKNKTKIIQYPNGRKETTYTIPSSVTSIGNIAFAYCDSLASINIPSSVTSIGNNAFSGCKSLTSISIPSSVTSIGISVFFGCDSLAGIYYAGSEAMWKTLAKDADVPEKTKVHYYSVAPGTVIGSALRTNITAAINGHAIPSFNVDGYTYIVAEDLKDYGFSVYYDNATRTLALSRDTSKKYVSRSYVKPYVPENEVGIKEHDLVATDIVTYIDNNYAQSYNINGQTIIRFDVLGRYGAVSYDNSTRIISVNIPGLN